MIRYTIGLLALSGCIVIHGDRDDECGVDGDCGDLGLCDRGDCVSALDLTYEVDVLGASVGALHPDGEAWDPEGGAPDLMVSFGRTEEDSCITPTVADTFEATWNLGCEFWMSAEDTLWIEVYDQDSEGYDLGASWSFAGEADLAALVRTRGVPQVLIDESDTVSVTISVEPLF